MLSDAPLPKAQLLPSFPALLLALPAQEAVVLVPKGPGIRARLALGGPTRGLAGSPTASGVAQPPTSKRKSVKVTGPEEGARGQLLLPQPGLLHPFPGKLRPLPLIWAGKHLLAPLCLEGENSAELHFRVCLPPTPSAQHQHSCFGAAAAVNT